MNRKLLALTCLGAALSILLSGCGDAHAKVDPKEEAPPPLQVEKANDPNLFKVDHPEQFQLSEAALFEAGSEVNATGVINPDISRNIPVISIAAGRVIEIHARLGDTVTKGQLLLRVQSTDISGAFSDYRQALADRTLARAQLERAKLLLEKGAIAQKEYEVAVDMADKTEVTVETAEEHLHVLGAEKDHPSSIIDVLAPASGVITDQQVTQAAGVQGLASPNPFTISDLSRVWIVCDVYENDLKNVRMGEFADVRLNAYPDRVFSARVSNIGSSLDPALRTAKVRLEVENPGIMRFGMFVTATFHGADKQKHAAVPASAILHLHDKDWVYTPAGNGTFRRVEVVAGKTLPDGRQEIVSGLEPGTQVIAKALILQNTAEQ
jgi:cobalt-zinc-cadmium efflux system membrane fusion protein